MPSIIVFRIFIFFGFLLLVDFLTFFALHSFTRKCWSQSAKYFIIKLPWITWWISIVFFLFAAVYVLSVSHIEVDYIKTRHYFNLFGILVIILFMKSLIILFKSLERFVYFLILIICKLIFRKKAFNKEKLGKQTAHVFFKVSLIVALVFLFLLSYGMIWGKYNFNLEKHEIKFRNLPESFNGMKIIQISDVHCGSFPDTSYLSKAVDIINKQNPDMVFFTGDLINNEVKEASDYIPVLKRIKAKYGKFAILGNHDMGDYRRWYTESGKLEDFTEVVKVCELMGFRVLLDENCYVRINNDSIAIIGVKSWSLPPFKKYGDLKKALTGIPDSLFKILLTHNPSHWNKEVEGKTNIDITFSGHTHGMQIGFYNKYFHWSPIQLIYPHWGGLYKVGEQYLNVNKGLGYLGIPIRLGINPEISLIVLGKYSY